MKILWRHKDGGPESLVWCWGIESKRFGSILLLKFGKGSREAFHTHAFNSTSWLLSGGLLEEVILDGATIHKPGLKPIKTGINTFHKVKGLLPENWVLTFRGPWIDFWHEMREDGRLYTLTHGRKVVKID